MKIQFGQTDITAALRAHIANQGINLDGKTVDIKFTMKKGNAGVMADVSIENGIQLPDLADEPAATRPALAVVASNTPAAEPKAVEPADPDFKVGSQPEAQATGTDDAAAPAVKTPSIFG